MTQTLKLFFCAQLYSLKNHLSTYTFHLKETVIVDQFYVSYCQKKIILLIFTATNNRHNDKLRTQPFFSEKLILIW